MNHKNSKKGGLVPSNLQQDVCFFLFLFFCTRMVLVSGIFSVFKCSRTLNEKISEATVIRIWYKNVVFETHLDFNV